MLLKTEVGFAVESLAQPTLTTKARNADFHEKPRM
jgi:hypothetical protein